MRKVKLWFLASVFVKAPPRQAAALDPVPENMGRLVLYGILANRISQDPDCIGVDFCSCLFDQSHVNKAYERGPPGFFSIDRESRVHLCRTVQSLNGQILENVQAMSDSPSLLPASGSGFERHASAGAGSRLP